MNLHTLILAAGAGRRFGGELKQRAVIDGHTVLERCVISAEAVSPGKVSVVLGFRYECLTPLASTARIIINTEWQRGLGRSIACGIQALPDAADAVLLVLCDQVALGAHDLELLWARYQTLASGNPCVAANAAPIICAAYADGLGVPAIFPRRVFPQLMALDGDTGAKKLLAEQAAVGVPLAKAAIDIDTQQQWFEFKQQLDVH